MRAWETAAPGGIDALRLAERPDPVPGPGEVHVRVRASSLNYRDLMTVLDPGGRGITAPRIPNSDGAGEVAALGEGVRSVRVGDRVAGCFFQRWPGGRITPEAMESALGGPIDGVLATDAVLREEGVVPIPGHLSFEEAATLPCAALTAWNGLVARGGVRAGETVLLLGTGGVSIFGLQLALLHGALPLVTSSSDEKLERARSMGARGTVNYRTHPEWHEQVLALTDGRGVDHVLEVGGAGTLERSLRAIAVGGHLALIGVLARGAADTSMLHRKSVRADGIYVGSREMFLDMNRAIEASGLRPVIDRTFAFEEAPDAFRHLQAGRHFGKVVVTI